MKKAGLILLLLMCFQQKVFLQNALYSKLHFTSKKIDRVSVDSLYHYQFSAIDSPVCKITFSVENLPAWLHFDSDNGSISGQPLKAGQYMIDILATSFDTIIHQRFMLTVYDHNTTNILMLGNSITNGTGKYNSYRRKLWQLLHNGNYNFDFIGSWAKHHMGGEFPDPDFDMDHEGHSGWTAANILNQPDWDMQRGNIHDWIKSYYPDIVLIELGTNEVFQCMPVKEAMGNISSIIDILRKKNKRVKIFVALIPPLGAQWADKKLCGNEISYGQALLNFNKQVASFALEKNTQSSPVMLADQYSGIDAARNMYDDIHPNEIGEKKMAEKWYKVINKYLVKLKG